MGGHSPRHQGAYSRLNKEPITEVLMPQLEHRPNVKCKLQQIYDVAWSLETTRSCRARRVGVETLMSRLAAY